MRPKRAQHNAWMRRDDTVGHRGASGMSAMLPAEVICAWSLAQEFMTSYRHRGRACAERSITAARDCPCPRSPDSGRTLHAWRTEFLVHFEHLVVSNGPTEKLNLGIKNTTRIARGFRNVTHYRQRLLLNHAAPDGIP